MERGEIAKWLEHEHERVRDNIAAVRETLSRDAAADFGAWLKELTDRFHAFRAHLIKHMALEEAEGFMDTVVARQPNLSGEVEALRQTHVEITGELARVMDALRNAVGASAKQADTLREAVLAVVERVREHEASEAELVLRAFTEDIGAGD